jgi:hypothetical protein
LNNKIKSYEIIKKTEKEKEKRRKEEKKDRNGIGVTFWPSTRSGPWPRKPPESVHPSLPHSSLTGGPSPSGHLSFFFLRPLIPRRDIAGKIFAPLYFLPDSTPRRD